MSLPTPTDCSSSPTFHTLPLPANSGILVGPVAAIPPEAVAHLVLLDALLAVAALHETLGALPFAAVELVLAAGTVGSPVADRTEKSEYLLDQSDILRCVNL